MQKKVQASKAQHFIHPESVFPGYQEFFWLFLSSCDSYQLSTHLSRRIAHKLLEMSTENYSNMLSKVVPKTIILAKFLGFLLFSPFWGNLTMNKMDKDTRVQANSVQPLICIKSIIERAIANHNLITVVPWICEFIGMSKWDSFQHIESTHYFESMILLQRLLFETKKKLKHKHLEFRTNTMLVFVMIERVFDDCDWNSLPSMAKSEKSLVLNWNDQVLHKNSDYNYFPIDEKLLFDLVPSLEELKKALLCHQESLPNSSDIKKMRPHVVSYSEQSSSTVFPPSPLRRTTKRNELSTESSIKDRLAAAFFHQHSDLQKIADFVADTCVRNFSKSMVQFFINEVIESELIVFESEGIHKLSVLDPGSEKFDFAVWSSTMGKIKEIAKEKAKKALRCSLEKDINTTMFVLVTNVDELVKDVATKLTIQHAIKKADFLVESLVNRTETKRMLEKKVKSKIIDV